MRACVKYLKEYLPKDAKIVAAEIGVHNGMNAQEILRELDISALYLIDPYVAYVDRDSSCKKWYIYDSIMVDNFRKIAEGLFAVNENGHKVKFIRLPSLEAINLFPDYSLDFVYIDALHSHPHVDNDINVWYPKVKMGGMLGGHDYGIQDVVDAVDTFAKENNIKLQKEFFETDWFIIKGDSTA